MKKKYVVFLMVFALSFSALMGCNTNNVGSEDSGEAQATTEEGGDSNSKDSEFSGQIMLNGSSTLAPIISAIAADFNEEYEKWNNVDSNLPEKDIAIYVSSGGSGQGVLLLKKQQTLEWCQGM